jgi:hypothetical protein
LPCSGYAFIFFDWYLIRKPAACSTRNFLISFSLFLFLWLFFFQPSSSEPCSDYCDNVFICFLLFFPFGCSLFKSNKEQKL